MKKFALRQKVETFLKRNLFLDASLKARILSLPDSNYPKILELLQKMDEKQIDVFAKIIKKNPHFIGEIEHMISHKHLKKLMQKEAQHREKELGSVETELFEMLSQV